MKWLHLTDLNGINNQNNIFSLPEEPKYSPVKITRLSSFSRKMTQTWICLKALLRRLTRSSKIRSDHLYYSSNNENKSKWDNWIIWVTALDDLSSFKKEDDYLDIAQMLREMNLNLIFITVGMSERKSENFKQFTKFTSKVRSSLTF